MTLTVGVVAGASVGRCEWSDLEQEQCAHCRGDDGTPGVYFADAPRLPVGSARPVPRVLERRPATLAAAPVAAYPALCQNPSCRPDELGGPRQAAPRSHVCPHCEDYARECLTVTAEAWPDLQDRLSTIRGLWETERVKADGKVGLALDQAVVDTADRAEWALTAWARIVRRDRGHVPPTTGGAPAVAEWLARGHVPWMCSHPDQGIALGFVTGVAEVRGRVWSVAFPSGTRVIPLHTPCLARVPEPRADGSVPEPDSTGSFPPGTRTAPCPGELTARIAADLYRYPDLICDTDPTHVVPPSTWQRWAYRPIPTRGDKA